MHILSFLPCSTGQVRQCPGLQPLTGAEARPGAAPAAAHAVGLDAERAAGVVPERHPDALTHFSPDHRSWKSVHGPIIGYFHQTVTPNLWHPVAGCFFPSTRNAPGPLWPQTRSLAHDLNHTAAQQQLFSSRGGPVTFRTVPSLWKANYRH